MGFSQLPKGSTIEFVSFVYSCRLLGAIGEFRALCFGIENIVVFSLTRETQTYLPGDCLGAVSCRACCFGTEIRFRLSANLLSIVSKICVLKDERIGMV